MSGNNLVQIIRGDQQDTPLNQASGQSTASMNYHIAAKRGLRRPANDNGLAKKQKMMRMVIYIALALGFLALLAWY